MTRSAVFLDRDGVLNRVTMRAGVPCPPASVMDMEILPSVPEALEALKAAGYWLVVVTNQPDVARGTVLRETVEAIHRRLRLELPLDAVLTCFHDDADRCSCRKPEPGLLQQAAKDFGLDLASSFMVGDRWRDVEAGRRAGCRTFLIDYGYPEDQPMDCEFKVESLFAAATLILAAKPAA